MSAGSADLNFDPLGYLLIVNAQVLSRDPDLVKRVTAATLKGFQYTIEHPDEAVAIMTKLHGGPVKARQPEGISPGCSSRGSTPPYGPQVHGEG